MFFIQTSKHAPQTYWTWKVLYVKQPTCDQKSSGVREYELLRSYSWILVDLRRLPILTHDTYYRTREFQIFLPIGPSSWYWPLISWRLLHSLLLYGRACLAPSWCISSHISLLGSWTLESIFISIHSIKKECYVTSLVCCPMQVQVPCYILQSHADLAIPPENVKYLSDNLGGRSAYELMHTTGHLPQLSHPAVVVSALQRAIAWVWTSKHHQNSSASYYWLSLNHIIYIMIHSTGTSFLNRVWFMDKDILKAFYSCGCDTVK